MRPPAPLILLALLAPTLPLHGQGPGGVRLGTPFGDHMVLPHDAPIVLYGTGCPGGDTVKVSIAGQTAWTRSDWQGHWEIPLKPMKAGGPFQLLVEIGGAGPLVPSPAANGRGGAELNDVMVGEVVLASTLEAATKEDTVQEKLSANVSSTHPFAFVRVLPAGAESSRPAWSFVARDSVPTRSANLFRLGAELAARLGMPVGVVESAQTPLCIGPAGCPASPESRPRP